MTTSDISSKIQDLTKLFADLSPLILIITAVMLRAISGYKKVLAAWPQKNVIG